MLVKTRNTFIVTIIALVVGLGLWYGGWIPSQRYGPENDEGVYIVWQITYEGRRTKKLTAVSSSTSIPPHTHIVEWTPFQTTMRVPRGDRVTITLTQAEAGFASIVIFRGGNPVGKPETMVSPGTISNHYIAG